MRTLKLTKALATRHIRELTALANLIPKVPHTEADMLADTKRGQPLLGKWEHSFVVMDGDVPVSFITGYERAGESNEQYPADTLYISELAVALNHQGKGVAKRLLQYFLASNTAMGFRYLTGPFSYSLQTNAAEWNQSVRRLYESFGFMQRATKAYDNRTDVVMGWTPQT